MKKDSVSLFRIGAVWGAAAVRAGLAWVLACASVCGTEPLKVGMELAYPPFEMLGTDGKPEGVSVDLAMALGEKLGRPVEIVNMPFSGLIPALKTGKVHFVISSMTATEERAKSIAFSDPYLRTGLAVLVGAKSAVQKASDLDAPGRTVAVKQGTTGQIFAMAELKRAKVIALDKENACVLEVVQGKADAFVYDQMSVWQNWKRHRETTRPLLEPIQRESWAVGLRKGDDALREQVNGFLKEFREAGGFERLGDRWLAEQKAGFAELGIPFVF